VLLLVHALHRLPEAEVAETHLVLQETRLFLPEEEETTRVGEVVPTKEDLKLPGQPLLVELRNLLGVTMIATFPLPMTSLRLILIVMKVQGKTLLLAVANLIVTLELAETLSKTRGAVVAKETGASSMKKMRLLADKTLKLSWLLIAPRPKRRKTRTRRTRRKRQRKEKKRLKKPRKTRSLMNSSGPLMTS